MSIVRIGLAETKRFSEGYAAIFGKKKPDQKPAKRVAKAKKASKRTTKAGKKKSKK